MSDDDTHPPHEPGEAAAGLLLGKLNHGHTYQLDQTAIVLVAGSEDTVEVRLQETREVLDILQLSAWRSYLALAAYLSTLDTHAEEIVDRDPEGVVGEGQVPDQPGRAFR